MSFRSGVLAAGGLDRLIDSFARAFTVIAPRIRDGAIVYEPIASAGDLARGWIDEQTAGTYRLVRDPLDRTFGYTVGPQSWKRYLFPPRQELWHGSRSGGDFSAVPVSIEAEPAVFFGVRACELAAIAVLDRVFLDGPFVDPGYAARRAATAIVAVNCGRSAATCFCTSLGTGPAAGGGYDLLISEIKDAFIIEAGSERGAGLLEAVELQPLTARARAEADAAVQSAAQSQTRSLPANTGQLLKNNLEHPRWSEIAQRCLSCANCTMVCPTCFCSTVEETSDLAGPSIARERRWDSCFNLDFSYIHGGSIRRETASRYRQWITHKLSFWHDQFGTSGCTGCGRCIAWCPAAIDITEEVNVIAAGVHVVGQSPKGEPG